MRKEKGIIYKGEFIMKTTFFEVKDILSMSIKSKTPIFAEQYIVGKHAYILFREEEFGDYIVINGNKYAKTSLENTRNLFQYLFLQTFSSYSLYVMDVSNPINYIYNVKTDLCLEMTGTIEKLYNICIKHIGYQLALNKDNKIVANKVLSENNNTLSFPSKEEAKKFLNNLTKDDILEEDTMFSFFLLSFIERYNKMKYSFDLDELFNIRCKEIYDRKLTMEDCKGEL